LDALPESLSGTGIEEYRSSFDGQFFIIAIFSLLSFKKALFLFSPLYLLAQYFFLKQQTAFETKIYEIVPSSIQSQLS